MKILDDTVENKSKIEKIIYLHFFYQNKKLIESNLLPKDVISIRYVLESMEKSKDDKIEDFSFNKKTVIIGIRVNGSEIITLSHLEVMTDNIL